LRRSEGAQLSMPRSLDDGARTILLDGLAREGRDFLAGRTVAIPRTKDFDALLITARGLCNTAGIAKTTGSEAWSPFPIRTGSVTTSKIAYPMV
jgi:hypothetical protein